MSTVPTPGPGAQAQIIARAQQALDDAEGTIADFSNDELRELAMCFWVVEPNAFALSVATVRQSADPTPAKVRP